MDDPLLALQSSTGTLVTANRVLSSIGMDSVMRFFTATAGDFHINAQGAGTDNGTFRLTADREAGGLNTNAHAVTIGTPLIGAIDDAADIDRYFVTLNAGTRYRVRLEGADSANGTLIDPYINGIRNAAGTVVAAAQDGGGTGRDAYVIYTPGTTDTYYIDADNGLVNTTVIGTYTLSVELWPL